MDSPWFSSLRCPVPPKLTPRARGGKPKH